MKSHFFNFNAESVYFQQVKESPFLVIITRWLPHIFRGFCSNLTTGLEDNLGRHEPLPGEEGLSH